MGNAISTPLLAATFLAATASAQAPHPFPEATATNVAQRFGAQLKCAAGAMDPQRAWCAVAAAGREPFTAPTAPTTYLGLSLELADGAAVANAALDTTGPAALFIGPGAVKVVS